MPLATRPALRAALAVVAGLLATVLLATLAPTTGAATATRGSPPWSPPGSPPTSPPGRGYDVEILDRPQLAVGGQAAEVDVVVRCPRGQLGKLSAGVVQQTPEGETQARDERFFECKGVHRRLEMFVRVDPFTGWPPLVPGEAHAEVVLFGEGDDPVELDFWAGDDETVTLRP